MKNQTKSHFLPQIPHFPTARLTHPQKPNLNSTYTPIRSTCARKHNLSSQGAPTISRDKPDIPISNSYLLVPRYLSRATKRVSQWAQVRRANVLRARPDLPANSTEGKRKKTKEEKKKKKTAGDKRHSGRRLQRCPGLRSVPRIYRGAQKIELSTRQSYIKGGGEEEEEDDRGKKERRRPDFYTPAMHHEYEWRRSEVRKAGIHIPGHIRHSSADPSCRLLTLSGRGNRQDTWGYRIYIQRPSVFTPPT